jgi:chemotaxis protein methyltransferase CheR
VHGQVCKRLKRRFSALGLPSLEAYRDHLAAHPEEWRQVDQCCNVTISRFYRDRAVFDALVRPVMPALASAAVEAGRTELRAWSAGCASGEEPYSLAIVWRFVLAPRFPTLDLAVIATDSDSLLLKRAERATYGVGSIRELPEVLRDAAFETLGSRFELKPEIRRRVRFLRQDLRDEAPEGGFDLVLCRNLAFTYFDRACQHGALLRLLAALRPGGALVIGRRERLPDDGQPLAPWLPDLGIFRRLADGRCRLTTDEEGTSLGRRYAVSLEP